MPRPKKHRKVCCLPHTRTFLPAGKSSDDAVVLTVDEYETVRLIDKEDYSQEECGIAMGIARATVQQIYTRARHKIACALVEGRGLRIEGGDYVLCDGNEPHCACGGCAKHRRMCNHMK